MPGTTPLGARDAGPMSELGVAELMVRPVVFDTEGLCSCVNNSVTPSTNANRPSRANCNKLRPYNIWNDQ